MIGTWFPLTRDVGIGFPKERYRRLATFRCMMLALLVSGLDLGHVHAAPPPNYVTATFDPVKQVLTLIGDNGPNGITITRQQTGVVTITASGQTFIGNPGSTATTLKIPYTNSNFSVIATLNGGDDYVGFVTVLSPSINLDMGSGNDYVKLTYCSVTNLTVDGNIGTNTLAELTTKVTLPVIKNIQVTLPL